MSNYIDLSYQPIAKKKIEILKKDYQNRILNITDLANDTQRPNQVDVFGTKNLTGLGNYANYNYVNLTDLFFCWRLSDVCMTISQALKRKVFKGGIQIKPNVENSSPRQEEMLKYICKCANKDNETLREVLEEIYDDLNWCDKGVMLKIKRYLFNSRNEIIGSNLLQVLRINPINFLEIRDEKSNKLGYRSGKKAYVNINNRKSLCSEPIDKKTRLPNLPVHYEVIGSDGSYYYNKSEIVYKNKFKKGGFSPLYAGYNKIVSLIEMDYFIRKEYGEGKPSKKMLAFKTPNRETTQEALNDYMESVKKNPNGIHPLNLQVTENKGSIAEVIDFMKPLTEMEFSETRQLFITQIGAPYGVSPMFMNDMSTGGGLNNEGLQITVTNEAVDSDKNLIIEYYLQDIKEELGCFDWDLSLLPSEEKDLVWTEDLFQKQLLNAEKYSSLGGKVKYDNGDFIYTEGYLEKKEENNFNNFNLDDNSNNNDLNNIDTNKNYNVNKSKIPDKLELDDIIAEIEQDITNKLDDIQVTNDVNKHKYLKRVGSSGNYKYYYTEEQLREAGLSDKKTKENNNKQETKESSKYASQETTDLLSYGNKKVKEIRDYFQDSRDFHSNIKSSEIISDIYNKGYIKRENEIKDFLKNLLKNKNNFNVENFSIKDYLKNDAMKKDYSYMYLNIFKDLKNKNITTDDDVSYLRATNKYNEIVNLSQYLDDINDEIYNYDQRPISNNYEEIQQKFYTKKNNLINDWKKKGLKPKEVHRFEKDNRNVYEYYEVNDRGYHLPVNYDKDKHKDYKNIKVLQNISSEVKDDELKKKYSNLDLNDIIEKL